MLAIGLKAATNLTRLVSSLSGKTRLWCNANFVLQIYKNTLQSQVLQSAGRSVKFGADLAEEKISHFQEDQIGQLYELMLESTKPNTQFNIQE